MMEINRCTLKRKKMQKWKKLRKPPSPTVRTNPLSPWCFRLAVFWRMWAQVTCHAVCTGLHCVLAVSA